MNLHVFPERAWVCVRLVAHFADVRFVRSVHVHVLLSVTAVCEASITAFELAFKWFFTCMSSFVNFQIFGPGKYFSTAGEGTGKGFLSRVDSDVIHQFVLGFKRLPFPRTVLPEADVVTLLGSADVLHGDVSHQLVHAAESSAAALFGSVHLGLVDPFAGHLLLNRRPHVPKECPRSVVRRHVHPYVHINRVVVVV